MKTLHTTDEVIDALGGTTATARIVGRKPTAVSNWRGRVRGKFPPETYEKFRRVLTQQNISAPLSLWGIEEPSRRQA